MLPQLLDTNDALAHWLAHQQAAARPVHFVPTMGGLHHGHGTLIERAAATPADQGAAVLVSVFVNPLQFSPGEDYACYPRNLAGDLALAGGAGAQALWCPAVDAIYPDGSAATPALPAPAALTRTLCGPGRPGHFDGVVTVMDRLLGLVRPTLLVLGEKDWQQLVILRAMVGERHPAVRVLAVATQRDVDGLAASSRNRQLQPQERCQARALPLALAAAAEQVRQGQRQATTLTASVGQALRSAGGAVDYVELVDPHQLQPQAQVQQLSLLATAVRFGATRLIDHRFLMTRAPIVAIDGPAGAGKSTVTRALARKLDLTYLDTGAMYRAVSWLLRERGVPPQEGTALATVLQALELDLDTDATGAQRVMANGEDVSSAIRTAAVTALVPAVAALPSVRAALTRQQRRLGEQGGLVAEGRDIGTAVFPAAELKVYLTATVEERARRRAVDMERRGFGVPPLRELEQEIAERDHLDATRELAPLCRADDAEELVTDGMTVEAVVERLVALFRSRVPEEVWPIPRR